MVVQKANSTERRKALIWLLISVLFACLLFVVGGMYIHILHQWLYRFMEMVLLQPAWLAFATFVLTLPLYFSFYKLFSLANSIKKEARCPPVDVPTVRDVEVLQGKAAIRRGNWIMRLTVLVTLLTVILPFYAWYLVYQITCIGS
jgi:hypothetical protein